MSIAIISISRWRDRRRCLPHPPRGCQGNGRQVLRKRLRALLVLALVLPQLSGCAGWTTWTTPDRDEIAKIRTVAVLTDASVRNSLSETPTAIDVPMNMHIARGVTEGAHVYLSNKGFTPVREESGMFVGAIFPSYRKILTTNVVENIRGSLRELDPPLAVEPASLQEDFRPLTTVFQQGHDPAPGADGVGGMNEEVREKRYLSQVRETGLKSDALMVIKIKGQIRRKKEPTLTDEFFMSVLPGFSIIHSLRADNSLEGVNMEVLFVNVKSGEVLWSGTFFKDDPDIEDLKAFALFSVNELSSPDRNYKVIR